MSNLKQLPKCIKVPGLSMFFAIPRNCSKLHKNTDFKDVLKTVTHHHVNKNKGKLSAFSSVMLVIELKASAC